uniref:Uncharacterized protein n=1 Tax=viral metagenome TaxID=1070528 RepID=A0A6M3L6H2_9ZZZZ
MERELREQYHQDILYMCDIADYVQWCETNILIMFLPCNNFTNRFKLWVYEKFKIKRSLLR